MTLKRLLSVFILSLLFVVQVTEPPCSAAAAGEDTPAALWVPSFNFMLDGRVAIDDRSASGGEAASGAAEGEGGAAAGAEGEGEEDPPSGSYNSDELSRWHLAQKEVLLGIYKATNSYGIRRNPARLMVSIVYEKAGELLMHNIEIGEVFLSGFRVEDTPMLKMGIEQRERLLCVGDFYEGGYQRYIEEFDGSGVARLSEGYPIVEGRIRGKAARKTFNATECHSERAILLYLKYRFPEQLNAFVRLVRPEQIKTIMFNIASVNDMCSSCQETIFHELRNQRLVLNDLKRRLLEEGVVLDESFYYVVAQSGIKEYAKSETRTVRGTVVEDELLNLDGYQNTIIHMENP